MAGAGTSVEPSPQAKALADVVVALKKAKRPRQFAVLFDALPLLAAAGDVAGATTVAAWLFGGRVALPERAPSSLAMPAADGYAYAAKLGDITGGRFRGDAPPAPLAARVAAADVAIHARLAWNAYAPGPGLPWRECTDPWRRVGQWREIQTLATAPDTAAEALELLATYLDALEYDHRGSGYGDELLLALDLELRLHRGERVTAWLVQHGHRLASSTLLAKALALPAIATAMARGETAAGFRITAAETTVAVAALDRALGKPRAAPRVRTKPPAVQLRRVDCEYSQVHLEPVDLTAAELDEVYFQADGEFERGMSCFRTKVAFGTPPDTLYVDARITFDAATAPRPANPVQAVAAPVVVRGPLVLRSVSSTDDDPLVVPPGTYDVLASFHAKAKPARPGSPLRCFDLRLSFRPAGSLDAPQTYSIE